MRITQRRATDVEVGSVTIAALSFPMKLRSRLRDLERDGFDEVLQVPLTLNCSVWCSYSQRRAHRLRIAIQTLLKGLPETESQKPTLYHSLTVPTSLPLWCLGVRFRPYARLFQRHEPPRREGQRCGFEVSLIRELNILIAEIPRWLAERPTYLRGSAEKPSTRSRACQVSETLSLEQRFVDACIVFPWRWPTLCIGVLTCMISHMQSHTLVEPVILVRQSTVEPAV